MKIIETEFKDLKIISPSLHRDNRGYFYESFNNSYPLVNFVQENESMSRKGVFRGFHYQLNPMAQAKLVRVVKGKVIDGIIDIRKGSPTYGKYFFIILSEYNKKQLFVPEGFAHGFLALEDCTMLYKVNNYYSKEHERGININSIYLKNENMLIANKDREFPLLENCETNFVYL